jgi:hypothetical protein
LILPSLFIFRIPSITSRPGARRLFYKAEKTPQKMSDKLFSSGLPFVAARKTAILENCFINQEILK